MATLPRALSKEHVASLDGLRGFAVTIVVMFHMSGLMLTPPHPATAWVWLNTLFQVGFSGVDLFFVLSGFLITGILLDSKGAANYFQSFYARRVLRIFPLYYLALSLILLFAHWRGPNWWGNELLPLPVDWKFYFVYLNNWWVLLTDKPHGSFIGHFWSLAVEEQFYFVWPLTVWLLPMRNLLRLTLFGAVAALAIRIALMARYGLIIDVCQNTFARMDTLLLGAAAACLIRMPDVLPIITPWIYRIAAASGAAFVVMWVTLAALGDANTSRAAQWSIGFTLLAVAFAGWLLFAYERRPKPLENRALTALGRYSYGIYVYHVPILCMVILAGEKRVRGNGLLVHVGLPLAGLVLTLVVAVLSYHLFEKRFLSLKKYFEPGRPAATG